MNSSILGCAAATLLLAIGCPGGRPHEVSRPPEVRPVPSTGTLTGRLTDHTTGLGLPAAALQVQDGRRPAVYSSASTDANGSYTLSGLPLGVPLRVVTQPVTGAVAYAAEVGAPVTLSPDKPTAEVNLACTQTPHPGAVAGTSPGDARRWRRIPWVTLVQDRDLGGGARLKVVLRIVRPAQDGSLRIDAVPPGDYEVHFVGRGHDHPRRPRPGQPRPRRRPHGRHGPRHGPKPARIRKVTVRAGATVHLTWPSVVAEEMEEQDAPEPAMGEEAEEVTLPELEGPEDRADGS